jgi:hypothetical protein
MRRYGVRLLSSLKGVNGPHVSDNQPNLLIGFQPLDNNSKVKLDDISKRHWDESWGKDEIEKSIFSHSMATWAPGSSLRTAPLFVRGEGIYLIDDSGKKHIDLTSQVIVSSITRNYCVV